MPPEILDYLDQCACSSNNAEISADALINNSHSWSIDVFSLGVMLIEIVCGVPVWMQHPCKVRLADGSMKEDVGLFALPNN